MKVKFLMVYEFVTVDNCSSCGWAFTLQVYFIKVRECVHLRYFMALFSLISVGNESMTWLMGRLLSQPSFQSLVANNKKDFLS